jgi:hypothetical protein
VNRAVYSIRKIMGSYPNGEIGMATVAEQTMAKNAEKVLMHTGQPTMRMCRRFLVLALPVVIIATRDENDELSKLR